DYYCQVYDSTVILF
nr:immunoglobulin light chain junction region [Macaca mulatta]